MIFFCCIVLCVLFSISFINYYFFNLFIYFIVYYWLSRVDSGLMRSTSRQHAWEHDFQHVTVRSHSLASVVATITQIKTIKEMWREKKYRIKIETNKCMNFVWVWEKNDSKFSWTKKIIKKIWGELEEKD